MNPRQRKTKDPCQVCFLHKDLCLCDLIPKLDLKTKITLVIHAKELKRTTNTGRLGLEALKNSEMIVRGLTHDAIDLSHLITPTYRTLLFYPSDEAIELDQGLVNESPLPIQLIVPDGSWRQASKVHYRHHELKDIPRVMISTPNKGVHHLRAETTEHGMSTLEAMARALGVIEGAEVEKKLLILYQAKLERTLKGRGTFKESLPADLSGRED